MDRKRKVAIGVAAGLLLLTVVVAQGLQPPDTPVPAPWQERFLQGDGEPVIAVVPVQGEIVSGRAGSFDVLAAADDVVSQLRQAGRDPDVEAVILRIDSPGGSVVASGRILEAVGDVRAAGTPVVASMGEVAASGGYFVATGADRIVADPSTITGSIGVIMVLINLEEAAGKLGIEPVVIKSGRFKDIGSPFRDMSPEERAMLQALIAESYERFVDVVAEGREMSPEAVREVADGRLLSGAQAHELGLVDDVGGLDDAVAAARELAGIERATVVEYEPPFSLRGLFVSALGGDRDPVAELEEATGATGPALKYLYVP